MNEQGKRRQEMLDRQLAAARKLAAAFGVHDNNIADPTVAQIVTLSVIGKKGMSALIALQAELESFTWPTFESLDDMFEGLAGRKLLQEQKEIIKKVVKKYMQLRADFHHLHAAEILAKERNQFETFSQQLSEMIDHFTFWLIAHIVDAGTTFAKDRKMMWMELMDVCSKID